ncbi:hypothetical protein K450DRAFT_229609 [Umbelopsis ramanniana AG]|uniref:Rho-GAP domain-containing protein n=1 Tax=Umbelopsis ramanniana AG TaxID=1314678 RepID=A0AAD5EF91_UMBRA|nr:uncharacterized protein K450DRAFT_229609 [Umbelopsis ramanniana AG]KAI8581861.1 hypothetical protein K450DRAFT_229609 [Umbelopsis ramanniana AG]
MDKIMLRAWWKKVTTDKPHRLPSGSHAPPNDGSIFSVLLETSIQYAFVNISYADDASGQQCFGQIPCIVAKCGAYLKDHGLFVEGIFRLSGSARRIGELQHLFDIPPLYGSQLDWQGYSIHDAANVLRRFLNSLPDPVITHKSYSDFRNVLDNPKYPNKEAQVRRFQGLIDRLPLPHQFLLLYLLDLLHLFASNSEFTRMDSANLASVFTPGMLSRNDMQPSEYKHSQQVIKFLIENQTLFSMPKANVTRTPSPTSYPVVTQRTPIPLDTSSTPISAMTAAASTTAAVPKSQIAKENKKPADEESKRLYRKSDVKSHLHHLPHKRLPHREQKEPELSHPHPMAHYRRSTTWLPPSHQPLEGVDIDAMKAAAAIRSGHLLPNERRKSRGLARSKTVPSKRPKYGPDDPLQVVHVNRGSSVRERRPEGIPDL